MTCEFISEPLSSRSLARPLDCVKLDVRGSGVPQSEKWPFTTERDKFAKKQAGAAHDGGFAPLPFGQRRQIVGNTLGFRHYRCI